MEALQLADWRRQVAELWLRWREDATDDPASATLRFRAAKDRLLADHPQSPLPPAERAGFPGLPYYPYDPAWRIDVRVEPSVGSDDAPPDEAAAAPLALPASGQDPFSARRVGMVHLAGPLDGHALPLFWIPGYGGGLFLPFRDATSGVETYGAGRYLLDTIKSADHGWRPDAPRHVLDLNMAFHPSCAFDPRWSCPLAPPESVVPVAVRAGERLRRTIPEHDLAYHPDEPSPAPGAPRP